MAESNEKSPTVEVSRALLEDIVNNGYLEQHELEFLSILAD